MWSNSLGIPMVLMLTTWPALALAGEGSWPFEAGGIITSPSIADINNDGQLEIVFGSSDGQVYCLDATATLLWQVVLGTAISSAPALANIDDDPDTLEVVVGSTSGGGPRRLYCLGSDGSELTFYEGLYPLGIAPVVTDLENDGTLEILFDENTADMDPDILHCVNVISDGSGISLVDRWSVPMPVNYNWYSNVGAPAVADFDGDGIEEVLLAGTGERPVMLINNEGAIQWSFRPNLSTTTKYPVIADMDGDGQVEVLIASTRRVYSLRAAGGYRNWQGVLNGPAYTLPAVADLLDDDNILEMVIGGSYGWFYAFGLNGQLRWAIDMPGSFNRSPSIGDLDGDGTNEIVFGTSVTNGPRMVHVVDRHGHIRWSREIPFPVTTSISLADLDGDGYLEIVFGTYDQHLYVLDHEGNDFVPQLPLDPPDLNPWPMFRHDKRHTGFYPRPYPATGPPNNDEEPAVTGTRPRKASGDPVDCPSEGDCCAANGSAGCEDADCCAAVCAVDPYCCAQSWDEVCALQALDLCESCPPLCPGEDDCCDWGYTAACDDPLCCETVCNLDPYCCLELWTSNCADLADTYCYTLCSICPEINECGAEGTRSCCLANATPFCDDADCCGAVCAEDPYCCSVIWDGICADVALDLCGPCFVPDEPLPTFVVTDLGTLGGAESDARDINELGQVVGWSHTGETAPPPWDFWEVIHPFLWENGAMIDLGTLETPEPFDTYATAINDAGQVVGGASVYMWWVSHAFLWQDGEMTDLGNKAGGPLNRATDINNNSVVVGFGHSDIYPSMASFIWTEQEGMHSLIQPWPGQEYWASGINDLDQVVGGFDYYGPYYGAYLWEAGEITLLFDDYPYDGTAWAINNDGLVAGRFHSYLYGEAFTWSCHGRIELGTLGENPSGAYDISDAGYVVGYSKTDDDEYHAFLSKDSFMYDLNDMIPADSGWLLEYASGINESNQIVGSGINPHGLEHGFLLTPCAAADLDCDGNVGAFDLAVLLGAWGPCPDTEPCPADVDNDGTVGPADLAELLGDWGRYP